MQYVRKRSGLWTRSRRMGLWSHNVHIVSFIYCHFSKYTNYKLTYCRLVGCPPFWHRKQMVMLRNIMEGKYTFTSPEWADISGKLPERLPVENSFYIIDYTF